MSEPEDHAYNCAAVYIDQTACISLDWPDRCDCALSELGKAQAALKDLIYVLKDYNGALFPGELTRQKVDVPINGFSALCEMGFESMENAHGKDWMRRRFDEVPWEEKWDRIAQSSAHNFLKRLDESIKLAEEAVNGEA